MKILVVHPYVPYPLDRGAYHRAFHLLYQLSRQHEVDLIALSENCEGLEHRVIFEKFCRRVEFVPFEHPGWERFSARRLLNPLPPSMAHWNLPHVEKICRQRLRENDYDCVQVCDLVMAQYFLPATRVPLVVDRTRVDLQYQMMKHRQTKPPFMTRLSHLEAYAKLWRYECQVAQKAALEIVCGPDDESFLRRHVSRDLSIKVIPNGVDTEYFRPDYDAAEVRAARPTLLFCGAMDYMPNIDALRWYFAEMHEAVRWLIPDIEVVIVGRDPVAEVKQYAGWPNVTVTGAVSDVRPFYRRAWLQMVPLRIGGGTRLKIVESLAMKTPVISTTIGAQGLGLRHEHDLLLADTAVQFVREIARALRDASLRERLAETGFQTVHQTLSWPMLGERFSRSVERIAVPPAGVAATEGSDHPHDAKLANHAFASEQVD